MSGPMILKSSSRRFLTREEDPPEACSGTDTKSASPCITRRDLWQRDLSQDL